jgi:hypothetical protein
LEADQQQPSDEGEGSAQGILASPWSRIAVKHIRNDIARTMAAAVLLYVLIGLVLACGQGEQGSVTSRLATVPTNTQLTPIKAAMAAREQFDARSDAQTRRTLPSHCSTVTFNKNTQEWLVTCSRRSSAVMYYLVSNATGRAIWTLTPP